MADDGIPTATQDPDARTVGRGRAMRIVTWNVQGRAMADPAELAARLIGLAPDVVCFQEIHRSQFSAIQRSMGWNHGAWWFKHWSVRDAAEGLATATRWPLASTPKSIALTHPWRIVHYSRRIAGYVTVAHPSGPIEVWNTHLSPGGVADTSARLAEIDQLVAAMSPTRAVLAGDLNFGPTGPEIGRLRAAGLTDGFELAHPSVTVSTNLTEDRSKLVQRLDYVLVTADLAEAVVAAHVPGATEPADTSWWALSDHLPLVVDVNLPARPG